MSIARQDDPQALDPCSLRAERRGESMLGTAFETPRLLLVEQPGPWGAAALRESRFDPRVAEALEDAAKHEDVRVQVVRSPGRHRTNDSRTWMFADCRDGQAGLRWGSFAADADLLDLPLDGSAGTPDPDPLYLVCVHGSRDRCCAERGRSVAAALAALRPGRVWESSHLGGHRFAANVLALPAGLLYGRVLASDAALFVDATEADEVLARSVRGQVGVPAVAQAALAFGYEQLALRERAALRFVSTSDASDGQATVRLRGPRGLLDVSVQVDEVTTDGTSCGDPGPSRYSTYRPLNLVPVG